MPVEYLTSEGDAVDWVCWKHYGRTKGVVEPVLAANPGLAAFGVRLPAGVVIRLPDIPPPEPRRIRRIWSDE